MQRGEMAAEDPDSAFPFLQERERGNRALMARKHGSHYESLNRVNAHPH